MSMCTRSINWNDIVITGLAAALVAFVTTIATNKNSMKKLIASKKTKAVRYSTSMLVYCLLHLTKAFLPAVQSVVKTLL